MVLYLLFMMLTRWNVSHVIHRMLMITLSQNKLFGIMKARLAGHSFTFHRLNQWLKFLNSELRNTRKRTGWSLWTRNRSSTPQWDISLNLWSEWRLMKSPDFPRYDTSCVTSCSMLIIPELTHENNYDRRTWFILSWIFTRPYVYKIHALRKAYESSYSRSKESIYVRMALIYRKCFSLYGSRYL